MLIKSTTRDSRMEQDFLEEYCFIHEVQTDLFNSV